MLEDVLECGSNSVNQRGRGNNPGGKRENKSPCMGPSAWQQNVKVGRVVGRKINPETGKRDDYNPDIETEQRLEVRLDHKSGCLTTVEKDNVVISGGWLKWWEKNKDFQLRKKYSSLDAEKAICMTARQYASWNGNFVTHENGLRKLTCIECERLQTVPDNYTNHVSNSQRYKMLGNGWTVDVIVHILKDLK